MNLWKRLPLEVRDVVFTLGVIFVTVLVLPAIFKSIGWYFRFLGSML